jgi:hypothetical protein
VNLSASPPNPMPPRENGQMHFQLRLVDVRAGQRPFPVRMSFTTVTSRGDERMATLQLIRDFAFGLRYQKALSEFEFSSILGPSSRSALFCDVRKLARHLIATCKQGFAFALGCALPTTLSP